MLRKTWMIVLLVAGMAGIARADGTAPVLTVNSISMPPDTTATLVVSGEVAGQSTFGVNILLEIVPQVGAVGTVEFTPEPPVDVVQLGDPWPSVGIFSAFDTGTTFSNTLNGSVDDNGTLQPAAVTFSGALTGFPVIASAGASGTWDVLLTTAVGDSNWEGLATKLQAGTITVSAGSCSEDSHCDDGINCTDDTCVTSSCLFTPNDANCTDDGVFCNGPEVCDAAQDCISNGDPCQVGEFCNETTDTCDECQVNGDCDDGLFCNGVETCASGTCQVGSDPCGGGPCDEVTDACFTSATITVPDISIPPGSNASLLVSGAIAGDSTNAVNILLEISPQAGTVGTLEFTAEPPVDVTQAGDPWPGVGTFTPFDTGSTFSVLLNGSTDESGTAAAPVTFTGNLASFPVVASAGASGVWDVSLSTSVGDSTWEGLTTQLFDGTITVAAGTCSEDSHCDDGVACTVDTCVSGACQFTPNNGNCSDGDVCTDNVCDAVLGCQTTNNAAACDDGDACTTNDTCSAGTCVGGVPPDCDDGNVCTDDSCDSGSGCVNTNNTAACDDGDACTTNDTCSGGTCVGGAPPNCDDGNVCTDDSCDSGSGCVNTNNTAACDDGDACTTNDTCSGGTCVGGVPPNCDDGDVCTDDSCDSATGCVNTNNTAACDDGDACTTSDTCSGGTCVGGVPPNCDDGNGCTDDSCDPVTGCVNTNNTSACDDGDACTTNDTCSGGTCVGGVPPNCDDGNVCTDDSCDPVTGCVNANNTVACEDGDACTTNDTCSGGACVGGVPPNCDDGNVCTDDSCDSVSGCVNTDNTAPCDDGDFCTATDTCSLGMCVGAGTPCPGQLCDEANDICVDCFVDADCDDMVNCTDDTCVSGACVFTPNDANCPDDGLFCTGNEVCDAVQDCVSTGDPCTGGDLCDETNDVCGECVVDGDCDDGVGCTDDTCVNNACVFTANDANCPDDGFFCTGTEYCDPVTDCSSTGDPCPVDDFCNDSIDQCLDCIIGANCDDGVACTTDSCVDGSCVNTPNDANCPDDGLFCTGDEVCDAVAGCVSSGDPCQPGQLCDEASDSCGQCLVDADCDDGVGCTNDTCVSGSCLNTADDANCPDDGLFCTGDEVCDAALDCISTGSPCVAPADICVEAVDACVECQIAADCDDGVGCTDHSCVSGSCVFTPNDANCPDDGLFCNGGEICDAALDCVSSGDPCPGGTFCNESTDACDACILDTDCDDGIGCTDDTCASGSCVFAPNDTNCVDDGLFCNGVEVCDGAQDCVSTGDPCLPGELCDETTDSCGECLVDGDCDDAVGCTDDTCVAGSCVYTPNDSNCPDDGLFCTGNEVCDPVQDCVSEGDPCAGQGQLCNEGNNTCADCILDTDCDDGVGCTDDACVGGSCLFTVNDANCPDDGQFCNGTESCDAVLDCISSGDPCGPAQLCDETVDTCGECVTNADCDDGVFCTDDACVSNACLFTPNDSNCADDGQFCNGDEICDAVQDCVSSGDPCPQGELCNEATNSCGECLVDGDCDDGVGCTDDTCVAGGCAYTPNDANCADDGAFCNGPEICNLKLDCQSAGDPCPPGDLCDESTDTCGECLVNADCDDGVFCNGAEVCLSGTCQPGGDPCPGQLCDEINNVCADCLGDLDCDDGNDCTGNVCSSGSCTFPVLADGVVCGSVPNGACDLQDTCLAGVCQDNLRPSGSECRAAATECDVSETCTGSSPDCPPNDLVPDGTTCSDDDNECTNDVCASGVCTHPALADGVQCNGAPSGDCDLQDICISGVCEDLVRSAGALCRAAANECDVAENCDGVSGDCPVNGFQPAGTLCSDDLIECTSDVCNGAGACTHPPLPDGTACGSAPTGLCDAPDTCTAGSCTDNVQPSTFVCRPAVNECDVDDNCNGVSKTCPSNVFQPPGTACPDDNNECTFDQCNASGVCTHPSVPNGQACTDDNNECTNDVCQSGGCAHLAVSAGTPCGDSEDTVCDNPDTCDGAGACQLNAEPAGTACGDPTNSSCDDPDSCDGFGACAANFAPAGFACGNPITTECDLADSCDGSGTCDANLQPQGTPCGDPTDNFCTDPDTCAGNGSCAPNDFICPPTQVCAEGPSGPLCVDCTTGAHCDDGQFCNGQEFCSNNICVTPGDVCDDGNPCTADSCNESGDQCANVADDGIDPDDGVFCNGTDVCSGGVLIPGNPPDCSDGNQCTDDFCDGQLDTCVNANRTGSCDDGFACTENDACTNGECVGEFDGGGSGEVNLTWQPPSQTVYVGDPVQIGLVAKSSDSSPDPILDVSVILNWDPTYLSLLGKIDNGPYNWSFSLFPNDVNQDDMNGTWADGDALYIAQALFQNPAEATNQGLLITTFEFDTHNLHPGAKITIPECAGETPTLSFVNAGAFGGLLHGTLGSATIKIVECLTNPECDDGVFCNGTETCVLGVCQAGANPCVDQNVCTTDSCSEATDTCVFTPITGNLDQDGLFCNGIDRCEDGALVPGTPPNCDDGNVCTDDSCDEVTDSCTTTDNTVTCNDNDPCTTNDKCNGGVCVGTPVGPDCMPCETDDDCDDGIDCTIDLCDTLLEVCEYEPNDSACPDDGLFCTGPEICDPAFGDPVTGCTSAGPPCVDCSEVEGCLCAPPIVEAVGAKYLKVTPQPPDLQIPVALAITYCGGSVTRYVGPLPQQQTAIPFDLRDDGVFDGTVAGLVNNPAQALFLTPAEWMGTVYVTGEEIFPNSVHEVQADCGTPGNPSLTGAVSVITWEFGDVDQNGLQNFDDINAGVLGFQGAFVGVLGPTTKANLDIDFCYPNQVISIADVFRMVQAFQGQSYEQSYADTSCVLTCP